MLCILRMHVTRNPENVPTYVVRYITGVFDIHFEYVSVNGTGTGEIALDIVTVDGIPLGKACQDNV